MPVHKESELSDIRRLPHRISWELNNPLLRLSCWYNDLKYNSSVFRTNLLYRLNVCNNNRIKLINIWLEFFEVALEWLTTRQNIQIQSVPEIYSSQKSFWRCSLAFVFVTAAVRKWCRRFEDLDKKKSGIDYKILVIDGRQKKTNMMN